MDFNKLWQNFLDTVQNHYMDFNGRVGRPQFWYFVLVSIAVILVVSIVAGIVGLGLLEPLVGLALLLPTGALAARRIQDTGQNGSLVWIWILASAFYGVVTLLLFLGGPIGAFGFLFFFFSIGWLIKLVEVVVLIAIIYFCAQPGIAGPNQYGAEPPVFAPN